MRSAPRSAFSFLLCIPFIPQPLARTPDASVRAQASGRQSAAPVEAFPDLPRGASAAGSWSPVLFMTFLLLSTPLFWPSSVISTITYLFEKLPNCFLEFLDYFTFLLLMS